MTFNPSIPLNSDSPAIFPAQSQTNYSRLQTLLGADHQFNLTAAANDGYHNLIHMTVQAPTGALATTGRAYVKLVAGRIHDHYMDDQGTEYQITPTMPIRASVNFNGTGAVGVQVIRSQFNVASVTKVSSGVYTVAFTTAMPDANYIVQVTGMRGTAGQFVSGFVLGAATYASSVTTTSVKVQFSDQSNDAKDVLMGNVTIFSVT